MGPNVNDDDDDDDEDPNDQRSLHSTANDEP